MERTDPTHNLASECRLLVIAGHPLLGEALAALLRQAGGSNNVVAATEVEQAASRAADFQPHSVLIDWNLPAGGAVVAAQSIRSRCPRAGLIFLDDALHETRVRVARGLRASGYFTLDDPVEDLLEGVRRVGRGGSAFGASARRCLAAAERRKLSDKPADQRGLEKLTRRQIEVLMHLVRGRTVKQCAEKMGLSPSTVDNHKSHLMRRLGVHKAVDLVHVAVRENLFR